MEKDKVIGHIIEARVTDQNDDLYFLQYEGTTFRLDKKEVEAELVKGALVSGFAYENEDHEMQITKKIPTTQIGRYAFGEVVASRRDLGVFVDIGLPNKDVAVSLDELPELTNLWPKKGDSLMIALRVDAKGRLWGTIASEEIFKGISGKADTSMKNKNVEAIAYRLKMAGTHVITSDFELGFIHPSERDREPRLGEHLNARVIGVRPDGTLNLSLRRRAYEAISDDAQMILAALQHSEGVLNYTDKSTPKDIKDYFGISKGQFKRAVGHLMKAGLVKQTDGKMYLNEK
ncbi:MAG: S1-like domain-containing RNA-binding protein [Liquorilactobacillus hordei]|uniref:DNA-binding protein n=1 Tax=Liquorilactobacillus hordei TaxID=468911 RepID=A0A3S6QQ97_9LACO|nr:S1-like domain-containing RNA-binding protein [Liquorilactobacillus hordei]AUJ29859.1 DNA-binding protein [Liquorilactobacillus hordei]